MKKSTLILTDIAVLVPFPMAKTTCFSQCVVMFPGKRRCVASIIQSFLMTTPWNVNSFGMRIMMRFFLNALILLTTRISVERTAR